MQVVEVKGQAAIEFIAVLGIVGFLIISGAYYTKEYISLIKNASSNFSGAAKILQNYSQSASYGSDFEYSLVIPNSTTFSSSNAYLYIFSKTPKRIKVNISSPKFLNLSFNSELLAFGTKEIAIPFTPTYPGSFDVLLNISPSQANEAIQESQEIQEIQASNVAQDGFAGVKSEYKAFVKPNYKISVLDLSSGFGYGVNINLVLFSKFMLLPIAELSIAGKNFTFYNLSFSDMQTIAKQVPMDPGVYNFSFKAMLFNKTTVFSYSGVVSTSNTTNVYLKQNSSLTLSTTQNNTVYYAEVTRQCTVYVNGRPYARCNKDVAWSYLIFSEACYSSGYGIDYLYCIYLRPKGYWYNFTYSPRYSINATLIYGKEAYSFGFNNTKFSPVVNDKKIVGNASLVSTYFQKLSGVTIIANSTSTKNKVIVSTQNLPVYLSALNNLVAIGNSINGKRISSDDSIKNAVSALNNASSIFMSSPKSSECAYSGGLFICPGYINFVISILVNGLPKMQFFVDNVQITVNQ